MADCALFLWKTMDRRCLKVEHTLRDLRQMAINVHFIAFATAVLLLGLGFLIRSHETLSSRRAQKILVQHISLA